MKNLFLGLSMLIAAAWAAPAAATVKVVTTTQDLAAITQEIGGSLVEVTYISRGDLDPHFVDAKPSYMVKLAAANLVACVGLDLEVGWLPALITGARNPNLAPGTPGYLDVSAGIRAIGIPGGAIDRSRGDLHAAGNPHYWLDPENGHSMAKVIEARLIQLDPVHAADYAKNLAAFDSKLSSKIVTWKSKMASLNGASVVGYHSTFDYLAGRFGLKVVGFVEPKPGIPPTPAHTLELSAAAKAAGAKFILIEPYHDEKDATPVATASGARIVTLPTSVGSEASIKTYTDLFDAIVRTLTGA